MFTYDDLKMLMEAGLPARANDDPNVVVGFCEGRGEELPLLFLEHGEGGLRSQRKVSVGDKVGRVETLVTGLFSILLPSPPDFVAGNVVYVKDGIRGTAGAILRDPQLGDFILSCHHVFCPDDLAGYDVKNEAKERVGVVSSCVPMLSSTSHLFDASIARYENGGLQIAPYKKDAQLPDPGDTVWKVGAKSQCTSGKTLCNDACVRVDYPNQGSDLRILTFSGQIIIKDDPAGSAFCEKGDSGSLVVLEGSCPQEEDPAPCPSGLLFARSKAGGLSVASPIETILDTLSMDLVPQP